MSSRLRARVEACEVRQLSPSEVVVSLRLAAICDSVNMCLALYWTLFLLGDVTSSLGGTVMERADRYMLEIANAVLQAMTARQIRPYMINSGFKKVYYVIWWDDGVLSEHGLCANFKFTEQTALPKDCLTYVPNILYIYLKFDIEYV